MYQGTKGAPAKLVVVTVDSTVAWKVASKVAQKVERDDYWAALSAGDWVDAMVAWKGFLWAVVAVGK